MKWGEIIPLGIQLLIIFFKRWLTGNKQKRELYKKAESQLSQGIRNENISQISAGFDALDRADRL